MKSLCRLLIARFHRRLLGSLCLCSRLLLSLSRRRCFRALLAPLCSAFRRCRSGSSSSRSGTRGGRSAGGLVGLAAALNTSIGVLVQLCKVLKQLQVLGWDTCDVKLGGVGVLELAHELVYDVHVELVVVGFEIAELSELAAATL